MAVGELADGLLYAVVFGPAYGESIVVRTARGEWIVIDSLVGRAGDRINPAVELLRTHEADPACLVLTHPHEDHADGFATLVARLGEGVVGACPLFLEDPREWANSNDAEELLGKGAAENALAAVADAWDRKREARWELRAGDRRTIGDVEFEVLAPDDDEMGRGRGSRRIDLNRLSSPMMLRWGKLRLLLGADLPAVGWKRVFNGRDLAELLPPSGLKAPHHGSRNALHESLFHGATGSSPVWVVTPWNRSRKLPRFDDGEGIDIMLAGDRAERIYLTALPDDVDLGKPPLRATRRSVADGIGRKRFGSLVIEYETKPATPADAWVAIGFGEDGRVADLQRGDRSVEVWR